MKRWLWYLLVIAAVAALSGKNPSGTDVGRLQPVQVVRVSSTAGQILIQTDTGDLGQGETLKEAFEDMKNTASSKVFLDTADYLILSPKCKSLLPALMEYLRPACSVCLEDGEPDLEQVGKFLEVHDPKLTLMRYRAGQRELKTLVTREGRMELVS